MNNDELARQARRVLEPLRVSEVATSSEGEALKTRERALPNLVAMIEGVPQARARAESRQKLRKAAFSVGAVSLALAAGVLLWLGYQEPEHAAGATGSSEQVILAAGEVQESGHALQVGSRYAIDQLGRLSTSAKSGAELVADGGVRIGFSPDSTADLAFAEKSRRIALNRGKVELDVPPLEKGSKLSVSTPNAVVVVHGTKFSVEYDGGATCVRVTHGVVSVQREGSRETLRIGQESGCGEPAERRLAGVPAKAEGETGGEAPRAQKFNGSTGQVATLKQENVLFRRALAAEQERDLGAAEANLRRLLERYPGSPLAGEARRVLARVRAARGSSSLDR